MPHPAFPRPPWATSPSEQWGTHCPRQWGHGGSAREPGPPFHTPGGRSLVNWSARSFPHNLPGLSLPLGLCSAPSSGRAVRTTRRTPEPGQPAPCHTHPGIRDLELPQDVLRHVVLCHRVHHEVLVAGGALGRPVLVTFLLRRGRRCGQPCLGPRRAPAGPPPAPRGPRLPGPSPAAWSASPRWSSCSPTACARSPPWSRPAAPAWRCRPSAACGAGAVSARLRGARASNRLDAAARVRRPVDHPRPV